MKLELLQHTYGDHNDLLPYAICGRYDGKVLVPLGLGLSSSEHP
jgi:hypothetical protein